MKDKPLILISNDDGYQAPGLHRLIDVVKDMGEVIAVAPATPQSGQSSAMTVMSPLRIFPAEEYQGVKIYAVTGTPVDCVKLALHVLYKDRQPDLMLSGINHGSNSGNSVVYSGTMGAALEACMVGIPAIGYSLLHHSIAADFTQTLPWIAKITRRVLKTGLPQGICLNVNFPAKCAIDAVKVCRAAKGYWTEEYSDYTDPHGMPFYWLTGRFHNLEPDNPETDEYWLQRNCGSIVPVRGDMTALESIDTIEKLLK